MRSFYLQIWCIQLKNGLFSGTYPLIYNLLYANSLYSSIFLESLSLAYNEVLLYMNVFVKKESYIHYAMRMLC